MAGYRQAFGLSRYFVGFVQPDFVGANFLLDRLQPSLVEDRIDDKGDPITTVSPFVLQDKQVITELYGDDLIVLQESAVGFRVVLCSVADFAVAFGRPVPPNRPTP